MDELYPLDEHGNIQRDDDSNRDPNKQLEWDLEQALREALTKGVSMDAMKVLCFIAGIPLARVTG